MASVYRYPTQPQQFYPQPSYGPQQQPQLFREQQLRELQPQQFYEGNRFPLAPPGMEREVFQHGSIGEFVTSSIEGVQSGFLRCIYRAKDDPEHTVTLLCEKIGGCCVTGCCPKDQFWMTGLIVLLVFVLLVFCVGAAAIIFCYQRSKNRERRERKIADDGYRSGGIGAESTTSETAIYSNDFRSPHHHHHHNNNYHTNTNKYAPTAHSPAFSDYTVNNNGRHSAIPRRTY